MKKAIELKFRLMFYGVFQIQLKMITKTCPKMKTMVSTTKMRKKLELPRMKRKKRQKLNVR